VVEVTEHRENKAKVITLSKAHIKLAGLYEKADHFKDGVPDSVSPSRLSVNLIQPGLATYYSDNVHQMHASVIQRHYVNHETQLALFERGKLPLTESDRAELVEAIKVLGDRLDEIVPKMAADITDHDKLMGNKASLNWPDHLQPETLKLHLHFCELIDGWNLRPDRVGNGTGTATVDEYAETNGVSRFSFVSKADRTNWLTYYFLDDFVADTIDANHGSPYYFVELRNVYPKSQVRHFLDVYRSAINCLAALNEESQRAIRNDGGKVGFVTVDHFAARQVHELNRISLARQMLGAERFERP
jgi:hypothetical protein